MPLVHEYAYAGYMKGWGDAEYVTLAAGGVSGGTATYQSPYPFNGRSANPAPGAYDFDLKP